MVNFKAEEKNAPTTGQPAPGENKVPEAAVEGFDYMGGGRLFTYTAPKHSLQDILRPGYFDNVIHKGAGASYRGALIIYTAGNGDADPETWSTGILRVCKVRGSRGYPIDAPTLVAAVVRFPKASIAAHDGGPAQTKAA